MNSHLIFVQLTIFVFPFTFILKSNDNETDEDIHHEECDDNNECDKKYSNRLTSIVHWAVIFFIGVYGHIQQTEIMITF